MAEKQLNVWISEELKNALAQRAEQENRSVKALVEELIQQDYARRQGELVEQQSLPVIREVIATEVRKAMAQLRNDLREDMELEILDAMKEFSRHNNTRLSKLITRTVRDSGINRRLVYAHLAKAFTKEFAAKAYKDAMENTVQELSARSPTKEEDEV